jgi:hypothetical protein
MHAHIISVHPFFIHLHATFMRLCVRAHKMYAYAHPCIHMHDVSTGTCAALFSFLTIGAAKTQFLTGEWTNASAEAFNDPIMSPQMLSGVKTLGVPLNWTCSGDAGKKYQNTNDFLDSLLGRVKECHTVQASPARRLSPLSGTGKTSILWNPSELRCRRAFSQGVSYIQTLCCWDSWGLAPMQPRLWAVLHPETPPQREWSGFPERLLLLLVHRFEWLLPTMNGSPDLYRCKDPVRNNGHLREGNAFLGELSFCIICARARESKNAHKTIH